jgi:2-haloacid dehalogenase
MAITTCIFDAYGTLFDVAAAARKAAAEPGGERLAQIWPHLAEDWRRKQLEYTWLRAIMGAHCDFWAVTEDGLDWAMDAAGLQDPALRARLLALYRALDAYAEVPAMLKTLKTRGLNTAILSNRMVGARFGTRPDQVLFVSSNGWDVAGAAAFGFHTVWVNRAGLPVDRLPGRPAHILTDLTGIPDLVSP